MSRQVVDYENLLETSFSDHNKTVQSGVRPRWERKKLLETAKDRGLLLPCNSNGVVNGNGASGASTAASTTFVSGDRFIPNRASMNMDLSQHYLLSSMRSNSSSYDETTSDNNDVVMTESEKAVSDAKKDRYASNLSSALLGVDDATSIKGNRIMSFQEKAPAPKGDTVNNLNILYSASSAANNSGFSSNKSNAKLVSRQIPSAPSRILDAPELMDDYYLNLVSWSDTNVLAVALGQTVYLWNAATGEIDELCTFDEGPNAHIASVSWVQEGGAHIAVGTSNGKTQLWDVHARKQLRSMDGHTDRVSALAWNRHILTSGSRDTVIVNHDVRVARHNVATLQAHTQEVCGLTWSHDGETLASGGNDNLLCLWDVSASSHSGPKFRLTDHQAAVKALAWSPHERNLLATGGGTADRTIKFWNTRTGALLNSIDTGSQVCALVWNPHEKEILSSHGFSRYQLSLWKYPSMAKIKEFEGHTSRVLHLALSPDGGTVLSAAGDETLRFWEIFAAPSTTKKSRGGGLGESQLIPGKTSWTTQIR